jgi:RNA polymerase sigma-70 factor, ECF subfamily
MVLLDYREKLFSYAMALTGNSFEAEDLVQETYVRALKAIGRFRETGNARAWLYTILRNIRLSQVRQQRRRPKLVELDGAECTAELVMDTGQDPHARYVSKMEAEQVRRALQQLPDEFREVILLREYRELSYEEIAGLLECPPGTVMSRLARARAKLVALLSAAQRHSLTKSSKKAHIRRPSKRAFTIAGRITRCLQTISQGAADYERFTVGF